MDALYCCHLLFRTWVLPLLIQPLMTFHRHKRQINKRFALTWCGEAVTFASVVNRLVDCPLCRKELLQAHKLRRKGVSSGPAAR